ncbi:antibiotic biosynthesis monooxygenase [Paenibacillus sp. GCM10027626]|uniref:antibiotic biosynthesis monooxygenase n=1 Tax=Paenibacillus sp. GCM10027626 TaxID=3273411 RepID=UPI00362894D7
MIVVENRIDVRAGYADAVLERFKTPKTVHTFPGFIRMDVLHAVNADGNEEVRVCTTWENEEAFEGWASSDAFRGAHARRTEAAPGKEAAENGPIIGNKMTIYRVAASHFPAAKPAQV